MPENQTPVALLGRLAIHNKMITMDQLAEATREQGRRRDDTNIGEILLELGFVRPDQLAALLRAQQQTLARVRAKRAAENASPGIEPDPAPRVAAPQRAAKSAAGSAASPPPAPAPPAPRPAPSTQPTAPAGPAVVQSACDADGSDELVASSILPVLSAGDRDRFDALLADCVKRGASDIHIHSGAPVKLRINGAVSSYEGDQPEAQMRERLALCPLSEEQRARFSQHGELDFCYSIDAVGRFRSNVFRQHRGIDAVFRFIPHEAPSLDQLGLPTSIAKFVNYHQGLVLCTGPAGCGKSSTLAALVNLINEERKEHILTIEDPIEHLHPSKRSLVNQRSVHSHTESFARALRAALREDPDVIVIGELRDLETISLALSAAETGHLVLATLHTNNAIRTLNRLIGAFPADQQGQIRTMMSESLRAVISQRLIPRADGHGRVAAVERLVITKAVANLIRENKTFQIHSVLQTGASQGMALLDHSIREHLQAGTITREDALKFCDDPKAIG